MLQGHTRAITQIKYNREGDLIFSAAKDASPCVWYSSNGERLGTFDGHNGTVWCLDVDWKTQQVLTGGGDMTIRLWDCESGKQKILTYNQIHFINRIKLTNRLFD